MHKITYLCVFADRPESSLTVASECSSTISSEEEAVVASKEQLAPPPKAPPSPTNSSISDDDEDVDGGDTWNTPTNQSTPIKDLNSTSAEAGNAGASATAAVKTEEKKTNAGGRLASLFNTIKIPKFRLKSNGSSEPSSLETTPVKSGGLKEKPTFSRSNSMSSDAAGVGGGSFVRNTKVS